jgi:hypothetical protein
MDAREQHGRPGVAHALHCKRAEEHPMESSNQDDLAKQLRAVLNELSGLRDEARVKLHLASMDARESWKQLETAIEDTEREAAQSLGSALRRAELTVKKARELVKSL